MSRLSVGNVNKAQTRAIDSVMGSGQSGRVFMSAGMDAGTASGMAFLVGELEKRDPRLLEPLQNVWWPKVITAKPGGGWVSFSSNYFVDYATTGSDEDSIVGSEANNIPVSQADISKDIWKVFTFANILRAPLLDQSKLQEVGRDLNQILDNGIRLNHAKTIDKSVHLGIAKAGTYGLVNSPTVTAAAVANGAAGTPAWATKTPDEILSDINIIITAAWAASGYDLTGIPNTILLPPQKFAYLVNQKISTAGNMSILQYLKENNIATQQGVNLEIMPNPFCVGAGANVTDRMVVYCNAEDRINFDVPVPLTRAMTAPNVGTVSFETVYAAQFSEVKVLYPTTIRYGDGI